VKICPVCATEYPDDIEFCQNDGTNLSDQCRFFDWMDSARTRNPGTAAYQTASQQCQ